MSLRKRLSSTANSLPTSVLKSNLWHSERGIFHDGISSYPELADHVPMSVSHGFVSEFTNMKQEGEPGLDSLHENIVGASTLIDLHVFKGGYELLKLNLPSTE